MAETMTEKNCSLEDRHCLQRVCKELDGFYSEDDITRMCYFKSDEIEIQCDKRHVGNVDAEAYSYSCLIETPQVSSWSDISRVRLSDGELYFLDCNNKESAIVRDR